jgi:hypothetical protein
MKTETMQNEAWERVRSVARECYLLEDLVEAVERAQAHDLAFASECTQHLQAELTEIETALAALPSPKLGLMRGRAPGQYVAQALAKRRALVELAMSLVASHHPLETT